MPKSSAVFGADPQDTVSFSSLVASLEDGGLDRDLSHAQRDLVARLTKQYLLSGGKPSCKIVLTIEFQIIDKLMHTKPSFRLDPVPERPISRFYPTADGTLTASPPPVQNDLPLPSSRKKAS